MSPTADNVNWPSFWAIKANCMKKRGGTRFPRFTSGSPNATSALSIPKWCKRSTPSASYTLQHKWKAAENDAEKSSRPRGTTRSAKRVYASVLGNLDTFYAQQQHWILGIQPLLQAIRIVEATYGIDHRETVIILRNLGLAYYGPGKFDEADDQEFNDVSLMLIGPAS
jgi:hypothetical protein